MRLTLEVDPQDLTVAEVVEEAVPEPHAGEAVLRVEAFGLTANVVTYATMGEALGYWRFFPASRRGRGRVPAWGFATVVASDTDAVREDARVFGYLPMSTHVVLTPRAGSAGLVDAAPHRRDLPAVYNGYRHAGAPDPGDARALLLWPLFMLAFLLADDLTSRGLHGADQVLVTSASSKTAIGLAHELARGGAPVTGLTSARHAAFTAGLGVYDRVVAYDDLERLDPAVASVAVDIAGNAAVRRRVHEHFGEALRHSALVGVTHGGRAAVDGGGPLPGPQPAFFFVPDRMRTRARDWGQSVLDARANEAFAGFTHWSEGWLDVVHDRGPDAVLAAFGAVAGGSTPPDRGHVASLIAP